MFVCFLFLKEKIRKEKKKEKEVEYSSYHVFIYLAGVPRPFPFILWELNPPLEHRSVFFLKTRGNAPRKSEK